MPLLDVTDILFDPDFATTFSVIRTAVSTTNGRNVFTPVTTSNVVGVVTPAKTYELQRLADGERLSGTINVNTTFLLASGSPGYTADQVIWNGRTYTVVSVDDYSQFGAGFVSATCELLNLQ